MTSRLGLFRYCQRVSGTLTKNKFSIYYNFLIEAKNKLKIDFYKTYKIFLFIIKTNYSKTKFWKLKSYLLLAKKQSCFFNQYYIFFIFIEDKK